MTRKNAGDHSARDALRPTDLGARGMAFWAAMRGDAEDNPARIVMLVEISRLLDTLERLNMLLNGEADEFAKIEENRSGELILVVDNVLSARRLHAATLRTLMNDLSGLHSATPSGNATPGSDDIDKPAPDIVDQLGAKRAARHGKVV